MSTETETKPKVNVKEIIARANAKTAEVKKSTAKVESVHQDYRLIPGFKQYEINSKNVVRNAKSKMAQTMKKGTGKFYLLNDAGERKLISLADIHAKLPAETNQTNKPEKPAKAAKAPKEKKVKAPAPIADLKHLPVEEREKVTEILKLDVSKYVKSWKLHKMKYANSAIAGFMGVSPANVARDIWMVNEGHREMPK